MGLEKIKAPATGTIYTKSVTANVWTEIQTSLTNVESWELVCREGYDFDYAFEDSPTYYRTNNGSGISKDTALTNLYVRCKKAATFELEMWRL